MNHNNEATIIRELMAKQAKAVGEKDIDSAIANYAPNVVIYDIIGALAYPTGAGSVRDRLTEWFSSFAEGKRIEFELVGLSVSAGEELAFSHSFNHVHGQLKNGGTLDMFWRETLNWQKQDGQWKIVHAHSSVPFDVSTGKAATGLKP